MDVGRSFALHVRAANANPRLTWSGAGTVRCKLMQPVCQATVLARPVALYEAPSSPVAKRTGDEGGGSTNPAGFELIFVVTAG